MRGHERSAAEIRRDIERTRADMDRTLDQLERQLSPRQMADRAWSYLRGHGDGIGETVREHPLPLSLMGLGMAWLAIEEARNGAGSTRGRVRVGTQEPAEGRVGPYRRDAIAGSDRPGLGERARSAISGAKDAVSGAKHAVSGAKDRASHAIESARDTAGSARDRVRDAAEGARSGADDLRRRGSDLAHSVQSFYRDSPLAAGAITFGLGLAAALSRPSTDAEDRLMGRASDAVKDRASEEARELRNRAEHVASETAAAAKEEARPGHDGEAGSVGDRVRRVAESAKQAVRESTDREAHPSRDWPGPTA